MPKISVIIPFCGAERYIERCVRSVMDQTLKDIEILCIDDCSPDNSVEIVQRLAAEDDRIRLIRHESNLGPGGARNTGIYLARAPYLASVDSDDYIDPLMLERLWDATEGQTIDVVSCGIAMMNEDGSLRTNARIQDQSFDVDPSQVNLLNLQAPAFWNKLWRTTLFTDNGITFPEHLYFEDLATTPRALRFAKRIKSIPHPLYHYVIRDKSITNSFGPKHIIDYFRVFDVLWNFLDDEGLSDLYRHKFEEQMGKELHYHTETLASSDLPEEEKTQYVRHMLLLKLAYLEHSEQLRGLDLPTLRGLLLNASRFADLPSNDQDPEQS
ncbi:glycosyltransferase family 2 protein [Thalassovita mangrovi]|uniref:Glycosyltransferase n=1 Tax=Thalassovita mangrovi TaxID=2692236 RepID=A0A6L8LLE2_9RHOB|nr:glycosyltransferase family 2 protein [Thalassovita mangrovi]MYM55836.1 glycosyltransferase [Thalassovita mangrovi]